MIDWTQAEWVPLCTDDCDVQHVAFARVGDVIGVRDSRQGSQSPVLEFTPLEWEAFVAGARDGEFDL
jgi:hypothetical protein